MIKNDEITTTGYECIRVILEILVLKAVSEPYIDDRIKLVSSREIKVDQLSSLCHIYGSDCEDGDKYVFELKRLITDSNWSDINRTLNGNIFVKNIISTMVKIYRMFVNFSCTMYCQGSICHSVNVFVDWITAKKWMGVDASTRVKSTEEPPLKIVKQIKMCFNESTAYSSPFQNPLDNDDHHPTDHDVKEKIAIEKNLSSILKSSFFFMQPYDYFVPLKSHVSDCFYLYFTNFVTTDFKSIYPTVLDFLPVKSGHIFGFGLNDVYHHDDDIRLIPRVDFGRGKLQYFEELVNGHHPSYDIVPNNFSLLRSYFTSDFSDAIRKSMIKQISSNGLTDRYTQKQKSSNYIKVNVFSIYGFTQSKEVMCKEICVNVLHVLEHHSAFKKFSFKIEKLYSQSQQTFLFVLFFYY